MAVLRNQFVRHQEKVVGEKLVGGQKKLDKDKDGDIDAKDFAMLRKDAKKEGKEKVSELTKVDKNSRETTPSVTKSD